MPHLSSFLIKIDTTAVYRWDQPYMNILIDTKIGERDRQDDLFINKVDVNLDDIADDDTMEEEKKLMMKRIYIAVYNPDRERYDLDNIDEKIEAVRKKMSETQDPTKLKKSLEKLKPFVSFLKNSYCLNKKRIKALKGLAGRFMIATNTYLPIEDIVKAYKEQWTIERSFRTIK